MEKEFDEALEKIGSLYEEGKDCLNNMAVCMVEAPQDEIESKDRLFEILRELRDISALAYKKLNTSNSN
jgi:hypothetical protein